MLDWKILAASIVALLFISSLFVGGGARDFFSDTLNKMNDFLDTSPFGISLPGIPAEEGDKDMKLLLSPETLTLEPDAPVDITAGEIRIVDYEGGLLFDFANLTMTLTSATGTITFPLQEVALENLVLEAFVVEDIPLELQPDLATDTGTVALQGFSGTALATANGLALEGLVASLRLTIGGQEFERL